MTSVRPRLLYLSPIWPRPAGLGLAMRAYRVLEALARHYRVSLLSLESSAQAGVTGDDVRSLCSNAMSLAARPDAGSLSRRLLRRLNRRAYYACYDRPSDWRVLSTAERRALHAALDGQAFDLVHVFRLYTTPVLDALPPHLAGVSVQLDLDDVESETRERLAAIAEANGDRRRARAERLDAEAYRRVERSGFSRFARVFVCSERDRRQLAPLHHGGRVDVLPNVVPVPGPAPAHVETGDRPFVFLFVGSLGHYPNLDGISFFVRQVVPLVRNAARRPFEVRVVAGGRRREWRRVPSAAELRRADAATPLADEYARADVVVVPIRSGGGTRIKALEGLAFRKAVVATPIGIEGLEARPGLEVLVGDSAEAFAAHCLDLMADDARRREMGERAYAFVKSRHAPDALARILTPASVEAGS